MTDACDLRFDFLGWATQRLGVSAPEIEAAVLIGAATMATTHGDNPKQERRDGQESDERGPRQERLLCCA